MDRDAALEAWRTQGQFNAIDPESGWKVDLIVREDRPYSRTEFERRERASLLLERTWDRLDRGYIDGWIDSLGLQSVERT